MKKAAYWLFLMLLLGYCDAQFLKFMKGPYHLLDVILMVFWKPIIKFCVISWSKPIICNQYGKILITAGNLKSTLSDADILAECNKGVEMFLDQFFVGGRDKALPYDLVYKAADGLGQP